MSHERRQEGEEEDEDDDDHDEKKRRTATNKNDNEVIKDMKYDFLSVFFLPLFPFVPMLDSFFLLFLFSFYLLF